MSTLQEDAAVASTRQAYPPDTGIRAHHRGIHRDHFAYRRSKHETKAGLAQHDRGSPIRFAIVSPC